MKLGKILIFMAVLAGTVVQGAELKEQAAREELDKRLVVFLQSHSVLAPLNSDEYEAIKAQKKLDEQLIQAVELGYADEVSVLLSQKANPNYCKSPNMNYDCLTRAIYAMRGCILKKDNDKGRSYLDIIRLLLASGANPDNYCFNTNRAFDQCVSYINTYHSSSDVDVTPLYRALELFLEYGADDTLGDRDGKTIHDHAEKNPELQRILDKHVQKVKVKIAEACPMFPMAIVHLCGDKLQVTPHDRALYRVVEMGAVREVEVLLKKNADPNVAFDFYGQKKVVLYKAFDHWGRKDSRTAPLVALLLRAKADPNCSRRLLVEGINFKPLDTVGSLLKYTKERFSIKSREHADVLGCVELLLVHKSDVNTDNGGTLIAKAINHDLPDLVALYLKHGADTDEKFQKHAKDKPEILQVCEEHRKQCAERIAEAAPELTLVQDFRSQASNITERIAGYIL
ncbi:MAG: hypothetical protein ACHQVS_00275 [Candidatus Babeliales bacterium]